MLCADRKLEKPLEEVKFLMNFNESLLVRRSHELNDMEFRSLAGRKLACPQREPQNDEAVQPTKNNREMTLTIALNYGGRAK